MSVKVDSVASSSRKSFGFGIALLCPGTQFVRLEACRQFRAAFDDLDFPNPSDWLWRAGWLRVWELWSGHDVVGEGADNAGFAGLKLQVDAGSKGVGRFLLERGDAEADFRARIENHSGFRLRAKSYPIVQWLLAAVCQEIAEAPGVFSSDETETGRYTQFPLGGGATEQEAQVGASQESAG